TDAMLVRARMALRMITIDDRELTCNEIGDRLAVLELPLRNTIRFDADGLVTCNEVGEGLVGMPMPQLEWNDRMRKGVESFEDSGQRGMALGDPAIYLLRRQSDALGNYSGSIALTLSLEDIVARMSGMSQSSGVTVS